MGVPQLALLQKVSLILDGVTMNQHKRWLVMGLCAVSGLWITGCWTASSRPHTCMETLAEEPDEHYHRSSMILERDRRALAEDLDLLFMTDRPTRLSKWHSR